MHTKPVSLPLARPFLRVFLVALGLFVACVTSAQTVASHGRLVEGLSMESNILDRTVHYSIYLPYNYFTSERNYPVVYLLHGLGDDYTAWTQFGEMQLTVDKAIQEQVITPMIIVMPDAGRSWYVNNYDGSVRYEDFFFKEFMPRIEGLYRIRAEKNYRGIAGLSMGGYGSLLYSMRHPDMFAACGALSAGVECEEEVVKWPMETWNTVFGPVYGPDLDGKARITEKFVDDSILDIVENADLTQLSSVRYYLDCGDDDFLFRGNALLHVKMRERDIPHEARMRDGMHNWPYWRSGLTDALSFISESFHKY